MQPNTKATRLGQVLLANAMIRMGHCPAAAAAHSECQASTIYRILTGDQGAGLEVATKLARAYPDVHVESWTTKPPEGALVPVVPRGKPGKKPAKEAA